MKRAFILLLVLIAAMFVTVSAGANPVLAENHYKVYTVAPPWTFAGSIVLTDQWDIYQFGEAVLEKFATPVQKNGEPILVPELHHTWWHLYPEVTGEGWNIVITNQFGSQSWHVDSPRYLVMPARKFEPGPPLPFNHYLAYEAMGPRVDIDVQLVDQFGTISAVATEPEFFLNPVEKDINGVIYEIMDPLMHLACYRLEPPMTYDFYVMAFDQFGVWEFYIMDHECLCLPSSKDEVVETQSRTWGDIKSLYR